MILKKIKYNYAPKSFSEIVERTNQPGYHLLDLKDYWENSCIQKVGIRAEVGNSIYHWSKKSLDTAPVAEVGGFLLGSYAIHDQKYYVLIETFVPAKEVDYSDNYQLDFGTKCLTELGTIQDEFPDLDVVGWFHTHPGLSPFLSKIDLKVQNGFFNRNFQLAIVLDPCTKHFDAGIFCKSDNEQINNKGIQKKWLSWKDFVDQAGH